MSGVIRTRGRVNVILNELVREGALVSFKTNFGDQGPIWVPTVTIQIAEDADLAAVLERVEKALRPLGVVEVSVEGLLRPGGAGIAISPESIQVDRCYLTQSGFLRQVTSTGSDGLVWYKERVGAGPWLHGGTRKLRRHDFAAAVVSEVPCDWVPEREG